jgi:tetratricopeptide (TPR) repeat protein
VAASRVTILASPESTHLEARGLLRLADLFLAPLTGGDPVWVAEALAAGVPAVVAGSVGGGRGLLPADVAAELTAESEDDYVRQAVRLASDATARSAAAQRIAATLESGVDFLDTLAASDAYGDLLQTAFDELETTGREAFRAERTPLASPVAGRMEDLLAAAAAAQADGDWGAVRRWLEDARRIDPRAVNVRALYGRALAAERAPERAAAYFLAALQQRPEEAEWWFELAGALRASGQNAQAIQALEASLRLDRSRSEGWLLLIELAEEAGAADIAREAFEALRLIAPDHPRIAPLAERLAS